MTDAASVKAFGMIGIDDAPVPPNTEPRMNTRGVAPLCVAEISWAMNVFMSFGLGSPIAAMME